MTNQDKASEESEEKNSSKKLTTKSNDPSCSSPATLASNRTTTILRNNYAKTQRPLSTAIEFPLRKRILRQLSLNVCNKHGGSCNSLMHNSYSSSSSSFQSSSELSNSSNYLSNINLNDKCDVSSTPEPRARIRQKKSHTLSDNPLRPQSWAYNLTTSTISKPCLDALPPSAYLSDSTVTTTCKTCLKPVSSLNKTENNNYHLRSQYQQATNVCRSMSTTGFNVNPFKRYQANIKSKSMSNKQEFTNANLVKLNLNKLGSSMPNLYYKSSISLIPIIRRGSLGQQKSNSYVCLTNTHSRLNTIATHCQCENIISNSALNASSYTTTTNTNTNYSSYLVNSIDHLRSSLRPRNSSTSSFSGSPVPKIDEEIDPIDLSFEYSNKKQSALGATKQRELFFPLIDILARNESSLNSSSSSQGSSAVKPGNNFNFDLTSKNTNQNNLKKISNENQSNLSLSLNDRNLLNRTSHILQLPMSDLSKFENSYVDFECNNHYSYMYAQKTRAKSLDSSRKYEECDIIRLQNERFKMKFPTACRKMKHALKNFIALNSNPICIENCQVDPVARFIHNQIIEIAKLCLEKTEKSQLTCAYFDGITNSLENLLIEAKNKCSKVEISVQYLKKFVKELLEIFLKPAQLLECFEFDQFEFFRLLEVAEASTSRELIKTSFPKYIISKLGEKTEIKDIDLTTHDILKPKLSETPSEKDFEEIKLISNGAYGYTIKLWHEI